MLEQFSTSDFIWMLIIKLMASVIGKAVVVITLCVLVMIKVAIKIFNKKL